MIANPSDGELWRYQARPVRVIDGDTLTIEADCGFGSRMEVTVRVAGIDAPERNTAAGVLASLYLCNDVLGPAFQVAANGGWPLRVRTRRTKAGTDDMSFARYVGDVAIQREDWSLHDVGALMVEAGHARPFGKAVDDAAP